MAFGLPRYFVRFRVFRGSKYSHFDLIMGAVAKDEETLPNATDRLTSIPCDTAIVPAVKMAVKISEFLKN